MPSWDLLNREYGSKPVKTRINWLTSELKDKLVSVSQIRNNRNVIFYSSAFLQRPELNPKYTNLTFEDINGFMSVLHGMTWRNNLCLILHTPGGQSQAVETIISYLHSKFNYIEVIVPTYAMSAGTILSLGCNRLILGKQSQLGPIDTQMLVSGRYVSAKSIVQQFKDAHNGINVDKDNPQIWAPMLQTLGRGLLNEAQNSLEYNKSMVETWLKTRMFKNRSDKDNLSKIVSEYFSDQHKDHGTRIDLNLLKKDDNTKNMFLESLDHNQDLQEAVLTAYHLITILYENEAYSKVIYSNNNGKNWAKSVPTE